MDSSLWRTDELLFQEFNGKTQIIGHKMDTETLTQCLDVLDDNPSIPLMQAYITVKHQMSLAQAKSFYEETCVFSNTLSQLRANTLNRN